MQLEMSSLMKNKTWDFVSLPYGKKAIPYKWVYKMRDTSDYMPKFKACLFAKGSKQEKGVDFDEIFSSIVKMTTLRCLL